MPLYRRAYCVHHDNVTRVSNKEHIAACTCTCLVVVVVVVVCWLLLLLRLLWLVVAHLPGVAAGACVIRQCLLHGLACVRVGASLRAFARCHNALGATLYGAIVGDSSLCLADWRGLGGVGFARDS